MKIEVPYKTFVSELLSHIQSLIPNKLLRHWSCDLQKQNIIETAYKINTDAGKGLKIDHFL